MIPKNSLKLTIPVQLSYGRVLGVTKPTPSVIELKRDKLRAKHNY